MTTRLRLAGAASALAAAALLLSGCVLTVPVLAEGGDAITERTVGDGVHGLLVEAAADVDVTIGDDPHLTVTGSERALDRLKVEERDGILVIGTTGRGFSLRGLKIELELTALDALELAGAGDIDARFTAAENASIVLRGAGDVDVRGVDAGSLTVRIDGAGDLKVSGTADSAEYRIAGAGEIDASKLAAVDAVAEIDGTGSIRLHATGAVDARTAGIGEIAITGGAEVTRRVDGLGKITVE